MEISEEEFAENFSYWKQVLLAGRSESHGYPQTFLLGIPATHTWGLNGTRGLVDRYRAYLHQKILFDDGALLSASARRIANGTEAGYVGPSAIRAELENYVFAYLGIHNPYYIRDPLRQLGTVPGFGIFIDTKLESQEPRHCHASWRDLDSPESKMYVLAFRRFLLKPEHGRELANLQAFIRHDGDPWRYWGAEPHFSPDDTWTWTIEFRFQERVPATAFKAILWPIINKASSLMGGRSVHTRLELDADKFQASYPNCTVIKYRVSARSGGGPAALIRASTLAARYFSEWGEFPKILLNTVND